MDMDPHFGEWYRISSLDADGETLSKRWEGIEAVWDNSDAENLLDVVRVFFGHEANKGNMLEDFKAYFYKIDPAFRMENNEVELRILCGALISMILKKNDYESSANQIGLATVCMDLKGLASPPPIKEIVERAQDHIIAQSKSLRSSVIVSELNGSKINISNESTELETAGAANNFTNGHVPIKKIIDKLVKHIKVVKRDNSELLNLYKLQKEELDILWWVFGEVSNDFKTPFSKLDISICSLVAGKELADLTVFTPGPFGAEAYLSKVLRISKPKGSEKEVKMVDAVNKAKKEWKEDWNDSIKDLNMINLCPVHKAVSLSLELGDEIWPSAFNKKFQIDFEKEMKPIDLALQVYQESLLIKSFR